MFKELIMNKILLPAIALTLCAASIPFMSSSAVAEITKISYGSYTKQAAVVADPVKVATTKAVMRDLWVGHIFWVRNAAIAGLANNAAEQKVAEEQVVANAQAIADVIGTFYGADAKKKMMDLLVGHYDAIKAYLNASIAKDQKKQGEATDKIVKNATEIAVFLSGANPFLPKDTLDGLLQMHGGQHMDQIQKLQAKNYADEAQTWDDMIKHIYVISDAMTDALAKQFPAKF
jgi:hypothetical protein